MRIEKESLMDFDNSRSLEWIETNGLGGYASGTVSGAHSRRYHGLLVAPLQPPVGRAVLLSKLDETIEVNSGSGQLLRYELGANQYPGAIHPAGFQFLEFFKRDIFPVFYFNAGGIKIKKTIASVHGENTTLVVYDVVEAASKFTIELLPLYSSRDYHSLTHANDAIGRQYLFDEGVFRTVNYHGGTEFFISVPRSRFSENQGWYYNFEYCVEQYRGLDFQEDLFTHGKFFLELSKGDQLGIIISTENPTGWEAIKMLEAEKKRREKMIAQFASDESLKRLVLAADQFVVKRGALNTIIAGYHWFADWGRDTMISLTGLCLATRRFKEAKQILKQFASSVSEGMLPNRFPDNGELPEYNTIDATLWFFHAVHRYVDYTEDKAFIKTILPVLIDIIDWHYKGTRYNIKVDPEDELLSGGAEGVQLTWMDAKVGDWVVTPRRGKAVEINALWYNALKSTEFFLQHLSRSSEAQAYAQKAAKVYHSFNSTFWNESLGYLYDFIDGNLKNDELRPNQLYALSLPYPLIDGARGKSVLGIVTSALLTPKGLRSLGPNAEAYKSRYVGDIWARDGCYHQGTVWSFLLGSYIDALFNVEPVTAVAKSKEIVHSFLKHIDEAGVGTVSEIFDAEPPYTPRGCIAQAWGVGEILRVILERNLISMASTVPIRTVN
ncbi:MAG: amylo-alpha-1,6-glucosidase [Chryseolinea sp.]